MKLRIYFVELLVVRNPELREVAMGESNQSGSRIGLGTMYVYDTK